MTPMMFEPTAPPSRVKHSTTEPLPSHACHQGVHYCCKLTKMAVKHFCLPITSQRCLLILLQTEYALIRQLLQELPDLGLLFAYGNLIRYDPTLVNLTCNFFVLCTNVKVYIIIHGGQLA